MATASPFLAALSVACLLFPVVHSLTEPSTCDRNEDCRNGGICKLGNATQTHLASSAGADAVKHCVCQERYFGPKCTRYCPLQCLNGGMCRFKSNDIGDEHLYGLDKNADHYECKCRGTFLGKHCETPFVACPDGSKCLNGGECAESSQNTTTYRCICPFGVDGKQCEGAKAARSYGKGPVVTVPPHRGKITGALLASLVLAVAIAFVLRMRQKRKQMRHIHDMLASQSDPLGMMGTYSDANVDGSDDEEETGIEATTIL